MILINPKMIGLHLDAAQWSCGVACHWCVSIPVRRVRTHTQRRVPTHPFRNMLGTLAMVKREGGGGRIIAYEYDLTPI
jgi:hypothetical protein